MRPLTSTGVVVQMACMMTQAIRAKEMEQVSDGFRYAHSIHRCTVHLPRCTVYTHATL